MECYEFWVYLVCVGHAKLRIHKEFFFLLFNLDLYMRRIFKGMCMIKHVAQRCLHIDKMRVLVCQYSGGTEHEAHLRLILPSCNSWHRYH